MNKICRVNIKKDLNKLARDLMKRCLWGEYVEFLYFTVIVKFIAPPLELKKKSFRRVWEVWVRGGPERATFTDSDTTHQFLIDFQGNCLYSTVPHMHGRQMFKKLSVYTLTPMEFEKFNSRIEPCIWGMILWGNNSSVFGTKS